MANHVYNYIEIIGNEKCQNEFENRINEILLTKEHNWMEYKPIEQLKFMPKHPRDQEGWLINAYDYYIDNIGAKWAHIEDAGADYLSIVSAWSPVSSFIGHLVQYLYQFDPNIVVKHNYTDEFHQFVGVQRATSDGEALYDYEEIEWGYIVEHFKEKGIDIEDSDFDWHDYNKKLEAHPNEYLDEYVWQWQSKAWQLMMN